MRKKKISLSLDTDEGSLTLSSLTGLGPDGLVKISVTEQGNTASISLPVYQLPEFSRLAASISSLARGKRSK